MAKSLIRFKRAYLTRNIIEVDGDRFALPRNDFYRSLVRGSYGEKIFMKMRPNYGDSVLDIGASVGGYTIRYARVVGEKGLVHAFEPEPVALLSLRRSVALNKLRNVRLYSFALGDKETIETLRLSRRPGSHSIVYPIEVVDPVDEMKVQVKTLDSLDLPKVDFIKIDVEGYELQVLNGAVSTLRKFRPRMQIEIHHGEDNCTVCPWLRQKGFEVTTLEVINPPLGTPMREWWEGHWVEVH